jgi:hypothetical protein
MGVRLRQQPAITTHSVHAGKLSPDLRKDGDVKTVDVFGAEELAVSCTVLFMHDRLNFLELGKDERVGLVSLGVNVGKHLECLVHASLLGEPAWRLGHEWDKSHEDECGDHLQSPGNAELGSVIADVDVAAAERDKVDWEARGNQPSSSWNARMSLTNADTPGDGPLLATDEATADVGPGKLGNVDGHLRRQDTDRTTVEESA